jgi:two-component system, LytTR family, response regulator
MLRAVIIDDIEAARRTLAEDVAACDPDVVVIGEASGVATGAALIDRLRPDLVFLDIQLDDGSGFDILGRVTFRDFKVIFTTASDAFGIQAIKFSALDYLLKPIDPDELASAVQKAKGTPPAAGTSDGIGIILESLKNMRGRPKRIALNTADRVHVVNVQEIVRCESDRNYTLFHLTGRRQILVTRTLKEFDEMLEGHGFFRTHHSHLVNIDFVKEYVKGDGGYIVMTDGAEVPVSVRKKDALMRALGS